MQGQNMPGFVEQFACGEFHSIENSEVVLWFGWLVQRETTNTQNLFKDMWDLVSTIWLVQQEPCVNHLKKNHLEHILFFSHNISD